MCFPCCQLRCCWLQRQGLCSDSFASNIPPLLCRHTSPRPQGYLPTEDHGGQEEGKHKIPRLRIQGAAWPLPSWHMDMKSGKAGPPRAAFPYLVTLHAPNAYPEGWRTLQVPPLSGECRGGGWTHRPFLPFSLLGVRADEGGPSAGQDVPCPREPPRPTAEHGRFSLPVKSRVLHQSVAVTIFNDHFTSHARKALRVVLVLPSHLPGKGACRMVSRKKREDALERWSEAPGVALPCF